MRLTKLVLAFAMLFSGISYIHAQDTLRNKKNGGYLFTVVKDLQTMPVKNQCRTGTCWTFSSLSFFESELLRMGKGNYNLSEMFIVRNAYFDKAVKYVRMGGKTNFGEGGEFHDIPYVIAKYGIVPEDAYMGLNYGNKQHDHRELNAVLTAMVNAVNSQGILSTAWQQAVQGTLDAYFGKLPTEFDYNGKKYTPKSFALSLGLNMDDYVCVTSYNHHPFYSKFPLEVEDNWSWGETNNVPIDEMIEVLDNAVTHGYSVAWAADVSDSFFSFKEGLALVPTDDCKIKKDNNAPADAPKPKGPYDAPCKEKKITQEIRQDAFDRRMATDDHGMHIVGIVKDQNGNKYYKIKNSWGTDRNDDKGFFYASEAYIRLQTTNLMMHKDALPKNISKKLNIR